MKDIPLHDLQAFVITSCFVNDYEIMRLIQRVLGAQ